MLDFEKEIMNAVRELTRDGAFQIAKMTYDEKNFGNALVLLKSGVNFNIRFIKDRGDVWCEVGSSQQTGEWFGIDDVLAIIGVQIELRCTELIKLITKTVGVVKGNFSQINHAFDEKHYLDTRCKIKELAKKRMSRGRW